MAQADAIAATTARTHSRGARSAGCLRCEGRDEQWMPSPVRNRRICAPHTLLALAEAAQGVAIIPSVLRTDRYILKIARMTHRRKPLRDRYVIQWDKRRPMPSYAQNFCAALAEYMREVLPITQPSSRSASKRNR